MQLVLEKRAERSVAIAIASPLIAIGLTLVTMVDPVCDPGQKSDRSPRRLFHRAADRSLFARRDRRQSDAAGDDRGRPVALLHRQCLEYRRRGAVPDRRDLRQLARGAHQRHRRRPVGAAGDAGPGRDRRRALCPYSRDLQGSLRRQRNPHQPDAGLCRQLRHGLSGARTLARSAWVEFPDHRRIRSGRYGAGADRRQPRPCRRAGGADRRCAGRGDARPHHHGISRSGWSAPRPRRRAFPDSTRTGWCC